MAISPMYEASVQSALLSELYDIAESLQISVNMGILQQMLWHTFCWTIVKRRRCKSEVPKKAAFGFDNL